MYRFRHTGIEVLLIHPGGPFWARKDEGVWSIPKGEYADGEDALATAKREFLEETGYEAEGRFIPLSPLKQPGGKVISAWAVEGDCNADSIKSNSFSMEWPPRSGKSAEFPEVDRAGWFSLTEAGGKLLKGQIGFIEQLARLLRIDAENESGV